MKKGIINGKVYEIISAQQFKENPVVYSNNFTAVEEGELLYPIKTNTNSPGVCIKNKALLKFTKPYQGDENLYSNENVIDFSNPKDMKEVIEKANAFKDLEKEILTNPDNIFIPNIGVNDSPEMVALKTAVIEKKMDIDKYADRFDSNFFNDKRLFKKSEISMGKLRNMCQNLDIKVTLTLEDARADVPNPIGRVITVDLTSNESGE